MDKKMSRGEAEDKAVKDIVEMWSKLGADKLTATLYNYSEYLVEGTLQNYHDYMDTSDSMNATFIAALRHFCEDGYLDQEKIQEEYMRALQQGIIDYTMPF